MKTNVTEIKRLLLRVWTAWHQTHSSKPMAPLKEPERTRQFPPSPSVGPSSPWTLGWWIICEIFWENMAGWRQGSKNKQKRPGCSGQPRGALSQICSQAFDLQLPRASSRLLKAHKTLLPGWTLKQSSEVGFLNTSTNPPLMPTSLTPPGTDCPSEVGVFAIINVHSPRITVKATEQKLKRLYWPTTSFCYRESMYEAGCGGSCL